MRFWCLRELHVLFDKPKSTWSQLYSYSSKKNLFFSRTYNVANFDSGWVRMLLKVSQKLPVEEYIDATILLSLLQVQYLRRMFHLGRRYYFESKGDGPRWKVFACLKQGDHMQWKRMWKQIAYSTLELSKPSSWITG